MTDYATIEYISGLMNRTASLTEADKQRVASLLQQYPYMAPLRYIEAAERQVEEPWAAEMLATAKPYIGNWLQFCAYIDPQVRSFDVESVAASDNDTIETLVEVAVHDSEEAPAAENETVEAVEEEVTFAEPIVEILPEPEVEAQPAPVVVEEGPTVHHTHMEAVLDEAVEAANHEVTENEQLIMPVYTEDYFRQQGVQVPDELPEQIEDLKRDEPAGSLMVMMSFTEWLLHFRNTSQKQKEEDEEQKALKAMWQKQKLAAAIEEEENDEIPENVFEMAVSSIAKEDGLASESLANIYLKQGKYDKAIDMYRKLSLRNPQKNAYFAAKIEEILKEKQS